MKRALVIPAVAALAAGIPSGGSARSNVKRSADYIGSSPSATCLGTVCVGGVGIDAVKRDRVTISIADLATAPTSGYYFLWDDTEIVASAPFCGSITVPMPPGTVRVRVATGHPLGCDTYTPATAGTVTMVFKD